MYRISYDDPAPSVTLTVNGSIGPVELSSNDPLQLEIAFDAGGAPLNAAAVYIGLLAPFGTYWLDPSQGFVTSFTRTYAGPFPSFGPSAVVHLPNAGVLPPGLYWWLIIVDPDGDGTLDADISAIVLTAIAAP